MFEKDWYYNKIKNESFITFPEILNIKKYINNDFGISDNSLYDIIVIINHKCNKEFSYYYKKFYNERFKLWI